MLATPLTMTMVDDPKTSAFLNRAITPESPGDVSVLGKNIKSNMIASGETADASTSVTFFPGSALGQLCRSCALDTWSWCKGIA